MSLDQLASLLSSPQALAVLLVLAVIALWRSHVRSDEQKDATIAALTASVGAFPTALTALTNVVADSAQRERDRPKNGRTTDDR